MLFFFGDFLDATGLCLRVCLAFGLGARNPISFSFGGVGARTLLGTSASLLVTSASLLCSNKKLLLVPCHTTNAGKVGRYRLGRVVHPARRTGGAPDDRVDPSVSSAGTGGGWSSTSQRIGVLCGGGRMWAAPSVERVSE